MVSVAGTAYTIDLDAVNQFVLRKQHLATDSRIDDIVQVVREGCGGMGFRARPGACGQGLPL